MVFKAVVVGDRGNGSNTLGAPLLEPPGGKAALGFRRSTVGERLLENRRDAGALTAGSAAGRLHGGALHGERELLLHARVVASDTCRVKPALGPSSPNDRLLAIGSEKGAVYVLKCEG